MTAMMDIDELLAWLRRWNDPSVPEVVTTVPHLFAAQSARTPDALAVQAGDLRLTYAELSARVNQLARHCRALGVGPEDVVAISLPRSPEMVVGLLAVLVAGGAFVPVDPQLPAQRRDRILADSGARWSMVATGTDPATIPVDLTDWAYHDQPVTAPEVTIRGNQLAYIIFTSGSTGTPKGAMIRHEAICQRIQWQSAQLLHFGPGDAALFKAPLSFDISVNEVLLPLLSGGYVVVAEPGGERDPEYLLELIDDAGVTFVYLVSSMLDTLLELARGTDRLARLRHVWCGGEVLTPELFERFRAQVATTMYHGYGPAEATIGVSHVVYRDSAQRIGTSIGSPNPNTQLYVLDERLQPVPIGAGGELYAAGFLLGRGYVNAPGRTAGRFVADPFGAPGVRMYRTGDLARWREDGTLEFLGRADNQVKLRGMRLELEEIEAVLAEHPAVRQAVVLLRETSAGAKYLAGYALSGTATDADLRTWCAGRLPEYMVPSSVTVLAEFPTTVNGKVDRRALPEPEPASTAGRAPHTAAEALMCEIVAAVLGRPAVGADDDFFAIGGDSILAIGIIAAARRRGLSLRARDILTGRTPAALARAATPLVSRIDADTQVATGDVPATPILSWLDEVGNAMRGFYQSISVRVPAELTLGQLTDILGALVDTHPILRARIDGAQLRIPAEPHAVPVTRLESAPTRELVERERAAAALRLDPAVGRLVEAVWFDPAPEFENLLVLVVHHTVMDGVSLRIIQDDLATAWAAIRAGEPPAPDRPATAFRYWARRLAGTDFSADLAFWQRTAGTPDQPIAALDPARDTVATERCLRVRVPAADTVRLLGPVPAAIRGGVKDVLVAALALAYPQWRGAGSALLLELEGHGREPGAVDDGIDLSRTVGWFTTLFPVALDAGDLTWDDVLAGGPALGSAVKTIKEQLRAIPHRGLSYGALRYLAGRSDLAVQPQLLFNYLGRFDTGADNAGWAPAGPGDPIAEGRDTRMPLPRPLEINAVALPGPDGLQLEAVFSWPAAVLDEDRVTALADRWVAALHAIAHSPAVHGPTPSDFPLVSLRQADVDALAGEIVPLTPLQQGIHFHSTFAAGEDAYVVQQIVRLTGPVDEPRLRRAADRLLVRHPNLAASFRTTADGRVVAVLPDSARMPWQSATAADDGELAAIAERQRTEPFVLTDGPLIRYALVRLPNATALIQTVHHLVADGWSVPIQLAELLAWHADPAAPLPAPVPFTDFLHWLDRHDPTAGIGAWTAALSGVTEPTRLSDALAGAGTGTGFGRVQREIPVPVAGALRELATAADATLADAATMAWGLLIGRLLGRTDVVVGATVSGRGIDLAGVERIVGLLINTVPARVRWQPGQSPRAVLAEFAEHRRDLVEHQHVGLLDIQRAIGVGTLFDSLVVLDAGADLTDARVAEVRIAGVEVIEAPHYPVTLMVGIGTSITLTLTHDRAILAEPAAQQLLQRYVALLDGLVSSRTCATIDLLADYERDRLLTGGRGPAGVDATVLELLADARAAFADRTAGLADHTGDEPVGYLELFERADRIAAALHDHGVRRGDVVAIALRRTIGIPIALIGILRAGAAYLPIDPGYPAERIEFMLTDAAPALLLTDLTSTDLEIAAPAGIPVLSYDAAVVATAPVPEVTVTGTDLVSLVYTSGSTGRPKAVLGTHAGLANRLTWARDRWSLPEPDIRIAKSSISFIDGTTELFGAIVAGATLVLADETATTDARALAELVGRHGAGQILAVPSLAGLLAEVAANRLGSVRRWILSGEALSESVVAALAAATPAAEIVNSYGSSEVAGDALTTRVGTGPGGVTLGAPMPGNDVFLLAPDLSLTVPGAFGELYVGGSQVARGYLGQPGVTVARFVANPYGPPGSRLYRTGDIGRLAGGHIGRLAGGHIGRLAGGSLIEFAGRADDQVSINGHRVELGEVEAVLSGVAGVGDAVVAARTVPGGSRVLDGYVTGAVDPDLVRATVAARLPTYLVPASITVLSAIPLLPNGKRDRHALPAPAVSTVTQAPRTPRSAAICTVVAAVLGVESVAANDDFFQLGGDSISAIRVVNRLSTARIAVEPQDLFRYRTAAALDRFLDERRPADDHHPAQSRTAVQSRTAAELSAARQAVRWPGEISHVWELSPLQTGVYFQAAYADAGAAYLAQNVFEFDRRLDLDALRRAFAALLDRHPVLRAGFVGDGLDRPVQFVPADVAAAIPVVDCDSDPEVAAVLADDVATPFDLATPPLIRLTLIRQPAADRLVLTSHFLLFDGWSRELVLRELFALYASAGARGALTLPQRSTFPDFLGWLAGRDHDAAAQAWRDALAGLPGPTLVVPAAAGREPIAPERVVVDLDAELTARIQHRARAAGVTLNTVLTSALGLLLGYLTGRSDVVFGTTVAGRPAELPESDQVIGMFLNTVPARVAARPDEPVHELLRRVQDFRLELIPHEQLSLGDIQRVAGGEPLFDTLYVLQNFLDDDTFDDLDAEHGIVGVGFTDSTHYPLTWVCTPSAHLRVKLEYRPDVVTAAQAAALVARFTAILAALIEDPSRPTGRVPVARPDEVQPPAELHPLPALTVSDLLAERAARSPAEPALVFGAQTLTYAELDAGINRYARALLDAGAGPERIVALALPRSVEMVVALFAVLRTGSAYLPLELDYPADRLRTMIDDAGPIILLCRSDTAELAIDFPGTVIEVDTAAAAITELSATPVRVAVDDRHPAYVIYTSGSTGKPKGVVTPYGGLTNMLENHRARIFAPVATRRMRVAHTVSFSFDMSWEELLWLIDGHEVHICDEELRRDAVALTDYCRAHRIDVINVTPTYAEHLVDQGLLDGQGLLDDSGHVPALVLLGGEAVPQSLWTVLREHPATRGYNLYGPTEYTINTLGAGTDDSVTATVGRPIWNTRAYVLDAWLRPVPTGTIGELYAGGAGLARGYLARPGLSASRFVADPFTPGARVYRTGDLVRYRADGNLDYLGRADDQLKIRGYRVEPGEIATALAELAGVRSAYVVARAGRLVAYVVTDRPDPAGLRAQLAQRLPDYMVPLWYGFPATLPMTVNGKVDVAALPEPESAVAGSGRAARTESEITLTGIIADVLGIAGADGPGVGVDDDFFTLGGDSISSIAVCGRARKAGLPMTPRDIFRKRTVAALLAGITPVQVGAAPDDAGLGAVAATPMLAETKSAATPLANFYQAMELQIPAELPRAQLVAVLQAVLDCHGLLRARLDADWTLQVPPAGAVAADSVLSDRAEDLAAAAAALDARAGRLVRAVRTAPDRLLLVIHHLVIDGVSWRILSDDLARAATAVRAGRAPDLELPATSFRTWSTVLTAASGRFAAERDYWTDVLTTPDPNLGNRALDPRRDTCAGVLYHTAELPAEITEALVGGVPARFYGSVNDVLLTGFVLAVGEWRRRHRRGSGSAVLLNLEGHGREAEAIGATADLSRTVGWFTSIYPARLDPGTPTWDQVTAAGPELATAAKTIKDQLRAIPAQGLGYGLLRYPADTEAPGTDPHFAAAPQILFNYLGRFAAGSGDWLPVGPLREGVDGSNPAIALEVNVAVTDGPAGPALAATLAFPTGFLTEPQVGELAELWLTALTALTRCPLAGHTPSDFPAVRLTPADVAALGDDVETVLPLLPLQAGMYVHAQLAASNPDDTADTYVVQQIAELTGPLEPDRLRTAIAATLARHQGLRASFRELGDGTITQVIARDVAFEWTVHPADADPGAAALARPFDLAHAPLVRYALVSDGPRSHRLIQTMHHIVADGWSYPLIFGDIVTAYNTGTLPPPVATLSEHIEHYLARDRGLPQWSQLLATIDGPSILFPDAAPSSGIRSSVFHRLTDLAGLVATARERGLTLGTVVHGAWGLVLGRLLDRDRVVFGSTVSGRGGELPGVDAIVGLLINTVPVPMAWSPADPVGAVFERLQEQQSSVLDAQLVGLSELARLAGVREFFDTIVVVENFPASTDPAAGPDDLVYRGFTGTDAPHYPLSLVVFPDADGLLVELKYDSGRVRAEFATHLAAQVTALLGRFADAPDTRVAALLAAAPPPAGTGSPAPIAAPAVLPADRFAAMAATYPTAIAVSANGVDLTYGELAARSDRLAGSLAALGVGPETRVGVAIAGSVDVVVAALAVVKAGGCYVPLDTAAPPERLAHILADAVPVVVLTDGTIPGIRLADLLDQPAPTRPVPARPDHARPDNAMYLIYTSGSTGTPKGVIVTARSLSALFTGAATEFDFGPDDVWTMFHSFAFDFSVWEMWGPLLHGGRLILIDRTVARDPDRFLDLLARERVTVLNQTPSAFYPLIDAITADDRAAGRDLALRYVIFGGEALDPARLAPWFERFGDTAPRLVNMFGITETCVHVTARSLTVADAAGPRSVPAAEPRSVTAAEPRSVTAAEPRSVTAAEPRSVTAAEPRSVIGTGLASLQVQLLDRYLSPVAPGSTGEIYVGGPQVARGYLGRPGLTAARFVADPWNPGARLYRSGDLARRSADGELDYLGRSDQQVKIRGFRIEPGEIEAALLALPEITNAAVIAREDQPGRRRLAAYLVSRSALDLDQVRAALADRLPDYLVPSVFMELPALP
ncbi:amino acid adenylation domain-containing protein, partial [Skermania piniformis]